MALTCLTSHIVKTLIKDLINFLFNLNGTESRLVSLEKQQQQQKNMLTISSPNGSCEKGLFIIDHYFTHVVVTFLNGL